MKKIATIVLAIVSLILGGCSLNQEYTQYPEYQKKVTLISGGYGYEIGDIVLIDTHAKPALGDTVQYDWNLNKSSSMAFGSGIYLAKIIGLPGDYASFEQWSYACNGYEVSLERYYEANGTTYEHWPKTKQVIWATEKFDNVASMKLKVPTDEYLADKWIGLEWTGEIDKTGSGITYNRFTIKRDAIKGVLLEKLGHDKEFEEMQKKIIY